MSDLVAFIRARVDEDETRWTGGERGGTHWPWLEQRMLREVEAKRRILNAYATLPVSQASAPVALLALAAVYSDHPEFESAWSAG